MPSRAAESAESVITPLVPPIDDPNYLADAPRSPRLSDSCLLFSRRTPVPDRCAEGSNRKTLTKITVEVLRLTAQLSWKNGNEGASKEEQQDNGSVIIEEEELAVMATYS
jgi:hypothetical protein